MKKIQSLKSLMPYTSFFITGKDTLSFLQGQLTQDVDFIKENNCQFGAFCSAKGAILGNFLIYKITDQLILRIHQQQANTVMSRLKLFVLRADVTITPTEHQHIGLNQQATETICQFANLPIPKPFETTIINNNLLLALPNGYYEYVITNKEDISNDHFDAINSLRLTSGVVDITSSNYESIMPQQTPLEYWGGISYTKGCYVGQEIIARSKYRGQVRKILATTILKGIFPLEILSTIKDKQGRPIGKIFDFQSDINQTTIQIIVDKTLIGTLIDSEYGPITFSEIK